MNDLAKAKLAVAKSGYAVSVYSGGHTVYTSNDYGIKPMYLAYTQGFDFSGCSGADKVVGLGAAIFWAALHIKHLHAGVVSKPALDFLIENEIDITHDTLVARIKNRTNDGFCPVETLATNSETFETFLEGTKMFLVNNNLL